MRRCSYQTKGLKTYKNLLIFPMVKMVLSQIKHHKLAVFSNGSRDMLEPIIDNYGLSSIIDEIIHVDDVKQYKPTQASYSHTLKTLNLKQE